MTTLGIAIAVVALLVVLTFIWSTRCARFVPPRSPRPDELERRRKERGLL